MVLLVVCDCIKVISKWSCDVGVSISWVSEVWRVRGGGTKVIRVGWGDCNGLLLKEVGLRFQGDLGFGLDLVAMFVVEEEEMGYYWVKCH